MLKRVFVVLFVCLIFVIVLLTYLSNYSSTPPAPPNVSKAQEAVVENRLRSAIEHPTPISAALQAIKSTNHPVVGAQHGKINAMPVAVAKKGAEVSVTFDQDDVNTMLATNSSVRRHLTAAGIQAAQVAFVAPNRVLVQTWTNYQGNKRQMQVEGVLSPDGYGGITFHTDSARLGLLPLPAGVTADQMDLKADKVIARATSSLPLKINAISATDGHLTLAGPEK